uniref:(northern house mosquito) hypothetical protein n=1 Tax=Culex pipiens TaxID=7175 RepID=A0A8D8D5C1_CULPI
MILRLIFLTLLGPATVDRLLWSKFGTAPAPVRQKGKVPVPEECECVWVCVCGWKNPNNICIIRRIDPEQDQLFRPWTVRGKIAFPCLEQKYIWTQGAASICSGLCPSKRLG